MKNKSMTIKKLGSIASFLQAIIFLITPVIYFVIVPAATGLTGSDFSDPFKLRSVLANPVFDFGDFLLGPVWAASLVISLLGMREFFDDTAPRQMHLAIIFSSLSAALFVAGGVVQTTGRHYISMNSELDANIFEGIFRSLSMVVPGLTSSGRHFLGWTLILLGMAGWTTSKLPRTLCIIYFIGALLALFAYLSPGIGELILLPGIIWNVWQGILLWRDDSTPTSRT